MSEEEAISIVLEWYEYALAADVGRLRNLASVRRGSSHRVKTRDTSGIGWTEHIEGAAAELAVAKYLGIYWGGDVDTFKKADVGSDLQIRWTPSHSNRLIIREADSDDDVYILVTGLVPKLSIRGWITGADAKKCEFASDPESLGKAFFIPIHELQPMKTLAIFADRMAQ